MDSEQRTQALLAAVDKALRAYVETIDFTDVVRAASEYEEAHPGASKRKMEAVVKQRHDVTDALGSPLRDGPIGSRNNEPVPLSAELGY